MLKYRKLLIVFTMDVVLCCKLGLTCDACHEKTDLKVFVVVILIKRRMGASMRAPPSFGMTKTLGSVF